MLELLSIHGVLVDYDEPEAIAKAVKKAKFDWKKFVGLSPEEIPLVGVGQVKRCVREVHSDEIIYSRELPNALKKFGEEFGIKGGYKFADPLTALRVACDNPNRQRQQPLAILFNDKDGKVWVLCLFCFKGKRCLHIQLSGADDVWDDLLISFLVVPADE